MNFKVWLFALVFPLAGLLLGFIVQKVVLYRIKAFAEKTNWIWDDIIIKSLRTLIAPVFTLTGCYLAIHQLPIRDDVVNVMEKVLLVLGGIIATVFCARFASAVLTSTVGKAKTAIPSVSILNNLVAVLVYGIGLLIILQSLGVSVTPMLTALGVGGLAVALALQDTLANFFSGINIILSGQIHVGDFIKIDGGPEGFVTDITWRNTTVRTLPNNLVVFPNSKLANSSYTNCSMPDPEMAVLVDLGVSYSSDLEKVERVTIEVAKNVLDKCIGGVSNFEPFIRYHTFSDFSIKFSVIMRGKEFVDQYMIKHLFVKELTKRYIEENIEIPFPVRTVYVKDSSKNE
jgi:small-conductance mechanosensitive channel